MKLAIASKNVGKIEGAKKAFEEYFQNVIIEGIATDSQVPDQPINEQIEEGCKNRIHNLRVWATENKKEYDYYLAIESGMHQFFGKWMITNIAMIEDGKGNISYGTSSSFPVPEKQVEQIKQTDLSKVMDTIFGQDEQRHNQGGGIQLLSHGKISRIDLTKEAFIMALTAYINEEKWR